MIELQEYASVTIGEETLFLMPDRALWWPSRKQLIIADLHLGKASHFNRHGSVLPNTPAVRDLQKLHLLCELLHAQSLLVLGDLFHSEYNNEFELLKIFKSNFPALLLEVVKGNHDILTNADYQSAGIILHEQYLEDGPFAFVHDPLEVKHETKYLIGGHIHPGVVLHGKARQHARLPCFYFTEKYAVLPAFGALTGLHALRRQHKEDRIFALVGEKVVELNSGKSG
ncbi:MAG: ligase-associated DNA damage response endonuclease PdeM [Bacteroidia bacterium]